MSRPASGRTARRASSVVLDLSRGHGEKDFLVYEDERTTFERHYRIAAAISRELSQRFGVVKGDRVSIAMRNLPEWAMAFWGSRRQARSPCL